MKTNNKFNENLADISVKIFQIVFAMLVVGMFLRNKFEVGIFVFGVISSFFSLTLAIILYYDAAKEDRK